MIAPYLSIVLLVVGLVSARVLVRDEAATTSDSTRDTPFTQSGERFVPTITLTGSFVPDPTVTITASLEIKSQDNIPALTSGQTADASPTSSRASHGLGIPDEPQPRPPASFLSSPVAWTSAVQPTATSLPPPQAPTGYALIAGEAGANDSIILDSTISARSVARRDPPPVVDWRDRYGFHWITSVQDQGYCGSCWAFAATALMETMVRIQHGPWSKRSEADLHDSMGSDCETGNWPETALSWAHNNGDGIADAACDPYYADDRLYFPCADRAGRSLRVPESQPLYTIEDQKKWIDEVGPITAAFRIFTDFDSWTPDKGVYRYDGISPTRGLHAVLVVGYDDNQKCWIIKNQWGTYSGDQGYYLIGYGEAEIEGFIKYGITNVDPDPWDRKSHQSGLMIQGGFGSKHKNFELVRANPGGGFSQIVREDVYPNTWYQSQRVMRPDGSDQMVVGQPIILTSSFNRDFEVLYLTTFGTLKHWYYSQSAFQWYDTDQWAFWNIGGYPGYVQKDDSSFSLVVRRTDGGLVEFKRDVLTADFMYVRDVATGIKQSGPALVASNVGHDYKSRTSMGNLYVVAVRDDGKLQMFWRSGTDEQAPWTPSEIFGEDIGDTPPVMVQDYWRTTDEKTPGGFQLAVAKNGRVQHWQRINTDIDTDPPVDGGCGKWELVFEFGVDIKHVWSLMHGSNHQLELVAEDTDGRLWHWSYEYPGTWNRKALVPGP
ncbi:uncharacterized protein JN550_004478 [Neoarthrinium moseri]|uniref:uncharacterized protein n=1 Tax=Neoarthrinium moseri TaxID=1658444 RepID=UPI001FDAFC14|nr:uncharacterized protein JN550_004478 [Neoarthrinium moseri]KAI1871484.1 hypothetical protein JN550_004478 [Neoarthrinium moseri]